jgi:hypothetical protein
MIYDSQFDEWIVPVRNWRERIAQVRAKKVPTFSKSDQACANNWNRCAVGEQRLLLPEIVEYQVDDTETVKLFPGVVVYPGAPIDDVLNELGDAFAGAVEHNDLDEAERLLDLIDDQVLVLKRAMKTEQLKRERQAR